MEKHPDIIQKFTNAMQRGMDYVNSHSAEEIAGVIQPQFEETDLDTLTTIVKRYNDQGKPGKTILFLKKRAFELLQDILETAGELDSRTSYGDLVTTVYAEKAAE